MAILSSCMYKVCVIVLAKISSVMLNNSKIADILVLSLSPDNRIIF